jgi:hypothetical protein
MPSITSWTRLEPRTRIEDPAPGMEARVYDPLWSLARQWQIGEFEGEDAGTPVQASIQLHVAPISRFLPQKIAAGETKQSHSYDSSVPLDAVMAREAPTVDLRLRASLGRQLLRALRAGSFTQQADHYRTAAPFATTSDPDGAAFLAVLGGRIPDGLLLLPLAEQDLGTAQDPALADVLRQWLDQSRDVLGSTSQPGAWEPSRLEYEFAMGSSTAPALLASSVKRGDLDWYRFDVVPNASLGAEEAITDSQIIAVPAPVRYPGMPALRFWQFEDRSVSFGSVEVEPQDLGRLFLI